MELALVAAFLCHYKRTTATVNRLIHHAHLCATGGESVRLAQATSGRGVTPLIDADASPRPSPVEEAAEEQALRSRGSLVATGKEFWWPPAGTIHGRL